MSNLGCFPVAESFLRSLLQSHEEEGSDGKHFPPPLDKPTLRNVPDKVTAGMLPFITVRE